MNFCRLIRNEFELREKMFLKIRDENEMEIATLKSINQSLEARLNAALDSDDGGVEILDSRGFALFCSLAFKLKLRYCSCMCCNG